MTDPSIASRLCGPRRRLRAAPVLLTAVLLASACSGTRAESPPPDAFAGSSPHAKLSRSIAIFERMIDDVLIDSHDALVQRGRNASGAYLPGFGAVFAIEFSLVGPHWSGDRFAFGNGSYVFRHSDEDWIELDDEQIRRHRTKQYVQVKEELVGVLGEYGHVLGGLAADEWVAIVARPSEMSWGEKKIKRLVIRARKRDIADRAADRIDAAAFAKRVVIEEYD